MSQSRYQIDDYVKWRWGDNWAYGHVKKVYTEKVTRTIKDNEVTRNASNDDPAYYIEQSDGRVVPAALATARSVSVNLMQVNGMTRWSVQNGLFVGCRTECRRCSTKRC